MLRRDDLGGGLFILQDPEAFCFGIDAVLLAHFPEVREHERICDLGCGFAPIPLILAGTYPDFTDLRITGIELQEQIAGTARRSVMENALEDRIEIRTGDIRRAASEMDAASFSLVMSNPPYVPAGKGIVGGSRQRAIARSEIEVTLAEVVRAAAYLLRPSGRFAMVHRPQRLVDVLGEMRANGLEPKRMRFVHPTAGAGPTMVLVEGVRGGRPELRTGPPLIVYNEDRTYTQEILDIYAGKKRSM